MFVCNTVTERVVFLHFTRFHTVLWRSLNWPDDAVPKMYSQWVRRVYFECPPGPNQRITIFDSASQSEDEQSDSSSSIQQPRLPSIECQTQSFWLFLVLLLCWKMTPVIFSFSLFYCEVLLKTKLEMYLVRVFKHWYMELIPQCFLYCACNNKLGNVVGPLFTNTCLELTTNFVCTVLVTTN